MKTSASQAQSELDLLQRKFRKMEANRRLFTDDSQSTRMQRQKIAKLKRDNERLKEELALETRQAKIASTMTATAQISKLQDTGELYQHKIETEKRRIAELDRQIAQMQTKILDQRRKMGGVNASRDNNKQIQKQIRMLENRLDKALVKYNEALGQNKKLREQIDNLRRERVVFDGIYRKLEKELDDKKNQMAQIIEECNGAYQLRDRAQREMLALKAQADSEQQQFEHEWRELGKLIEQDRKMKDFLKQKDKDRVRGGTAKRGAEEEASLRKRLSKRAWGIVKDQANIHISKEKVKSYEESFEKIKKATGIEDIDELVQTFINAEDQNFALFNHVNELSNQIEKLEENLVEVEGEIKKYKGQGVNTDNQRKKILEDLERRLKKTETKANTYEKKHQAAMAAVNSLKDGIQSILKKIGAEDSVYEMLGQAGVTESNMMQYLGLIEQKTNQLLQEYLKQHGRGGTPEQLEPVGHPEDDDEATLSIIPPTTLDRSDDDLSDDDDHDEPFSHEELHKRTLQDLSRGGKGPR